MKRLTFEVTNKLADVLKALKEEESAELEIFATQGSEVLKSAGNKKTIESFAQSLGKKVTFKSEHGFQPPPQVPKEENLGFVEDRDIAHELADTLKEKEEKIIPNLPKLPKVPKVPKIPLPKGKLLYYVLGFFGFLIIGGVFFIWFVPRATITLFTKEQFKESELTLTASSEADKIDIEKRIIPLDTLENSQDGVQTAKATGTKTVGTKAKGRVNITNRDTSKGYTFYKGLKITTVTGKELSFTLDDTVVVEEAPPGDEDVKGVNVTAIAIGADSNLPTGTVFKVGSADINIVFAKNETKFTGGTSNQVTIVSETDQKKLKTALLKKLETAAEKELEKENEGIVIPEGGFQKEIVKETYDKAVGEKADEFQLSLEVNFSVKVFSESDLKEIMIKSIAETIPAGFEIDSEKSKVESEILEKEGADLKVSGKIKASLIPKINKEEIQKNIAGKEFSTVDDYLKSQENISGFEIKISPSLFQIFKTLPFRPQRIGIEVVNKEDS